MLNQDIVKQISKTTQNSGVYRFIGENSEILYIGKAKNLRKRLLSYTKTSNLSNRIKRMTFLARKVEIDQTNSDLEAILLEHNLIKKFHPKFNILLKDDKSFASIAIDKKHQFGAITKYRGVKNSNYYIFGPFACASDVNRTIDILRKSFLLRNCSDEEFSRRKKPCLEYQIKRCSAPCVNFISQKNYQESIKDTVDFLSGKSSMIQANLAKEMNKLSFNEEFEKAALIRDKIKSLSSIQANQDINLSDVKNTDFIIFVKKELFCCIYISFYRNGNNFGSKPYFFDSPEDKDSSNFLSEFIGQFYQQNSPPSLIITNIIIDENKLMEEFLSTISDEKVNIRNPKLGYKLKLLESHEKIAQKLLDEKISQNLSDKKNLLELKEKFKLSKIPQRIEVYDNSHTSTQNAVGAMIVFGFDGFLKNQYRKFNIKFDNQEINNYKNLEIGKNRDDTAMLSEVLARRFKNYQSDIKSDKFLKEENNTKIPDLIIIDGGIPQLSAVEKIFNKLEIKIDFICMAKGEDRNAGNEKYFKINREIIEIKKGSTLAFFMQRLRDEAHRFAITSHRLVRTKNTIKSALDEINGIGSKRKKALLNYFGSVEKIKSASIQDLQRVDGISLKVATKIFQQFSNK